MRVLTDVMIVFSEYILLLTMCILVKISSVLLWVMNWIGEACAELHECISQLHEELSI